ncbi:Chloramphenicol acetyltransferase [anaerobic digester metagenome]
MSEALSHPAGQGDQLHKRHARFMPMDLGTWPRRQYFDYYFNKIKCRYSITAQVDITGLMQAREGRRFFPCLLYLLMAAVNGEPTPAESYSDTPAAKDEHSRSSVQMPLPLPEGGWPGKDVSRTFRLSMDAEGNLGWWTFCNPVYTLFHQSDCSFSDVWSEWTADFSTFYSRVLEDMARYGGATGVTARPDKPGNFCSISSLPWLSFTSFAQDTYAESRMLFPLLRAGKHYEQSGRTLLPLSVCVHHAVADGYHTSWLFCRVQHLANVAKLWLR